MSTADPPSTSTTDPSSTPTTHPSTTTTPFPPYTPPGPTDVRSPCPFLNSLSNHSILPHSGRSLTTPLLASALQKTFHTSPLLTYAAIYGGTLNRHLLFRRSWNLDEIAREKMPVKHDGMLGRPDFWTGKDVEVFDEETWEFVRERLEAGGKTETTFESVAKARSDRIAEATARDPEKVEYGPVQWVLSYGEVAAMLAVMAGAGGVVDVKFLDVLFAEERIPWEEGWRPQEKSVGVGAVAGCFARLLAVGESGVGITGWMGKLLGFLGGSGGKGKAA